MSLCSNQFPLSFPCLLHFHFGLQHTNHVQMPPLFIFSRNLPLFSLITFIHPSIYSPIVIHLSIQPILYLPVSITFAPHPLSCVHLCCYVSHSPASSFTPHANLSSSTSLFAQPSALLFFPCLVFIAPFFSPFLLSFFSIQKDMVFHFFRPTKRLIPASFLPSGFWSLATVTITFL